MTDESIFPLPEQLRDFVAAVLDGRVKQYALLAELDSGVADQFVVLEEGADMLRMLGALEVLKRDYMRCHIESRINYVEDDGDA